MKKPVLSVLIIWLIPFALSRAQDQGKSAEDFFLYSVGNSHTWDFRPNADFLEIARSMNRRIKNGWHINCGQNLQTIWQKPEQTCVDLSPYGAYREAISNHKWDAITIQAFTGSTGIAEKQAVLDMLGFISGSINKDCDVFLYCTWPKNTAEPLKAFNYQETWLGGFRENDTLRTLSEAFFNYLENSLEQDGERVTFIPVGRVLYHFDRKARGGEIPGFSGTGELYRDAWHLNNAGRYIAGLTVFSQIFRIDPRVVPDFGSYPVSGRWPIDVPLTVKQKELIRKIISEVLCF